MSRAVRMLLASALGALGLATSAGQAQAASWTEVPSGTTEEITAIEYQSATRFWFTTSSGSIFRRLPDGSFTRAKDPTGVTLNDIEFQAGGNVGLAVGNGGQVFRSDDAGTTWSANLGAGIPVSRKGTAFADCTAPEPLGDVYSVRFAGDGRAWIFAEGSQLARSSGTAATVGQAGTWSDANWRDVTGNDRTSDDTCKVNPPYGDGYSDGFFVPSNPDVGYIVAVSFSTAFLTADNLTSAAAQRTDDAGNAGSTQRKLAGDPGNPSRMWSVAPEDYGISVTGYTSDGFQNTQRWTMGNDAARTFALPYDVDYNGGTVLAAGDAGMIVNSVDGATFYYTDATGSLTTTGWRAVGLAGATEGAVGGVGGRLALTSTANAIPPVTAPPAGTPTIPTTPTKPRSSRLPVSFTGRGNSLSAKIVGRRVRIRARGTIKPPAGATLRATCKGKLKLTVKKQRTTLATRKAKLKRKGGKCRFGKTMFIKRSKVGRQTTQLRLKISFAGNAVLRAGQTTKTLVIKR